MLLQILSVNRQGRIGPPFDIYPERIIRGNNVGYNVVVVRISIDFKTMHSISRGIVIQHDVVACCIQVDAMIGITRRVVPRDHVVVA